MDKERWQQIKWEKDNAPDKFRLHEQEYIAEGFKDSPEGKKVKEEKPEEKSSGIERIKKAAHLAKKKKK